MIELKAVTDDEIVRPHNSHSCRNVSGHTTDPRTVTQARVREQPMGSLRCLSDDDVINQLCGSQAFVCYRHSEDV